MTPVLRLCHICCVRQVGPVSSVHMPKDKVTGKHQGYGFVEFKGEDDADYAIKVLPRQCSLPSGRCLPALCLEPFRCPVTLAAFVSRSRY